MSVPPLRTVRSAGGVVCDDGADGARRVLLILQRGLAGRTRWTLPKGRLEPGETSEDAALREVREETGHGATIVEPLTTIDYRFLWRPDGVRYHKYVDWFLMRWDGLPPEAPDGEAEHVEWVTCEAALVRLVHDNERALIDRATRAIAGGNGA